MPREAVETWAEYADETDYPGADRPHLTYASGGNYIRIHIPGTPAPDVDTHRRGEIRWFSYGSRQRLMRLLASLDRSKIPHLPLFITLTYPAEYPTDFSITKRHLDTFTKRIRRRYHNAAIIWKLELQTRGAPHYHLLVFGVQYIPHQEVANDWYEIVGSKDTRHLMAGTETKAIESWNGVMYYASKYLAKVVQETTCETPGRFWGVIGRDNLPIEMMEQSLSWTQAYDMRRVLWRRADKLKFHIGRKTRYQGIHQFIDDISIRKLFQVTLA